MEKKQKLIIGGVIVGILLIVLVWQLLPSGPQVDPTTAAAAKEAAQAQEEEQKQAQAAAPPLPAPPPASRPKSGIPRSGQ